MTLLPRKNQQSGIALIALLAVIILAGGYAFYRSANISTGSTQEESKLRLRLAEAKTALIAYAVIDAKRPGRLLCPDLIGNGISPLLTRDDCNAYGGGLPWKTLDLKEGGDDYGDYYGDNFRYFLSPSFGGQSTTKQLNSDTKTSLHLDVPAEAASNDIAAIIIATRGPLDPRNADGDDYFYSGSSQAPDDNDLVITVTSQELMAAVEQRIANEIRVCLEQHASSVDNLQHTYPWPAPLLNDIFKGVSGSLFGMVPETQPGNPDAALSQTISKLSSAKNSLDLALTAGDLALQKTAILEAQEFAAYARTQFDRILIVASALSKAADEAAKNSHCGTPSPPANFKSLYDFFNSGTKNGTVFATSVAEFAEPTKETLPTFAPLLEALINSGFELLTMEVKAQNATLVTKRDIAATTPNTSTLEALLSQINELRNGALEYGLSSNSALNSYLTSAYNAAKVARDDTLAAKTAPENLEKTNLALASTDMLIAANNALLVATKAIILPSALIERSDEIIIRSNQLADLAIQLSANVTETERLSLLFQTENARALVDSIKPSTTDLSLLHRNTLQQLDIGLRVLSNTSPSRTSITTATLNISKGMFSLANAIHPDLAREALIVFKANLVDSINSPPATLAAGQILRDQITGILFWANAASAQANDLARLARKSICASGDSTSSAYTAASKLLNSIDGTTGALAVIDKPSNQTGTIVAKTAALLNTLIDKTTALEQLLEAPYAAGAVPTVWFGNSCSILKPPTSDPSWWSNNDWRDYYFYQLSEPIRPPTGTLKVNGSGSYRTVILAAGKKLAAQDRSMRKTSNFLEGKNQDPSRNGNAQSPVKDFSSGDVSATFNDHLSY